MRRSRTVFAMIDAAATDALRPSPRTRAWCAGASEPSEKPSTKSASARSSSAASDSRKRRRFVRCSPSRSIARLDATRTTMRSASRHSTRARSSRVEGRTSFESFNPDRARRVLGEMRVTSRHTAATTNGPARAPRPASSAPATRWTPRARSKRKSARDGGAPRLATAASLEYAPSSRPCRAGSTAWRDGRHPRRPAQFSRSWASGRGTYARHRRRSSACAP